MIMLSFGKGHQIDEMEKAKTVENRKWPVTQKCRNQKSIFCKNVENLIWTVLEAIIIKKW